MKSAMRQYYIKYRGICPVCNATLIKFDRGQLLCLNCFNYFDVGKSLNGKFRTCKGCGKLMYRFPYELKEEQHRPKWGKHCRECANKIIIPPQIRNSKIASIIGKLGGAKGGPARAIKLGHEKCSIQARRAARIRWARYKQTKILGGEQKCQSSPEHSSAVLSVAPNIIMV